MISCNPQELSYGSPRAGERDAFIWELRRGHKPWFGHHEPNKDMHDGVFTCTRRGTALINGVAVEMLFDLPSKQTARARNDTVGFPADEQRPLDQPLGPLAKRHHHFAGTWHLQ